MGLMMATMLAGAGQHDWPDPERPIPLMSASPTLNPSRSAPPSPAAPSPGEAHAAPSPTPSASNGTGRLPPIPRGSVPILYYHRVQAPPSDYFAWPPARKASFIDYDAIPSAFSAQLDWLQANGYTTILPRDLVDHWDRGAALPPKPVILTFDDGFHDWTTTVLPMLEARHMKGEFYLTLSAIATGSITWTEVETLAKAGEGIGAHDVHHVQLAARGGGLPDASPATMWAEVHGARQAIGAHIGIYPDSMAYVGGGFSPELEALAQKAGYTTARSILRGIVQTSPRRYELCVIRIGPFDDVINVVSGLINPNLPTFIARMHGVSDVDSRHARAEKQSLMRII
jgi:peptidoglycan/xylan/chitin deacetylase (PgdA/CDA1 family)